MPGPGVGETLDLPSQRVKRFDRPITDMGEYIQKYMRKITCNYQSRQLENKNRRDYYQNQEGQAVRRFPECHPYGMELGETIPIAVLMNPERAVHFVP